VGWSRTCRHRCPGRAVRRGRGALDHLWDRRTECDPVLIVVDEAHKVCSAKPGDPLHALATERLVQIAAEDGKYGLWLALATQQPGKIHPRDLALLGETFRHRTTDHRRGGRRRVRTPALTSPQRCRRHCGNAG
jgi:DNA helicase HerA-like ATPase